MTQAVECLLIRSKALRSNPNTNKTTTKKVKNSNKETLQPIFTVSGTIYLA
jgi:hypothetical protein